FIAVHCGYAPMIPVDLGWSPRTVYAATLATPTLISQALANTRKRIQAAVPNQAARIGIAVTEWGPLFQESAERHYTDAGKTLGSALFAASALNSFIQNGVEAANFYSLVDPLNIVGWIGSTGSTYVSKPSAMAFEMYTHYFGSELVSSTVFTATYDSP